MAVSRGSTTRRIDFIQSASAFPRLSIFREKIELGYLEVQGVWTISDQLREQFRADKIWVQARSGRTSSLNRSRTSRLAVSEQSLQSGCSAGGAKSLVIWRSLSTGGVDGTVSQPRASFRVNRRWFDELGKHHIPVNLHSTSHQVQAFSKEEKFPAAS